MVKENEFPEDAPALEFSEKMISITRTYEEHGSVTVFFVVFFFMLFSFSLLASDIAALIDARLKAEDAADAASLASLSEAFPLSTTGNNPKDIAKKAARMNRCNMKSLRISDTFDRATATVSISPKLSILNKFGIRPNLVVSASAEIDYDSLISCGVLWDNCRNYGANTLQSSLLSRLSKTKSDSGTMVALLALQQTGKPYVWGSQGPGSFDCSGLVYYVYRSIGIRLPRTSYAQAKVGTAVTPSNLAPGDLVFFRGNAHVGIYIGAGFFVHAPHRGDVVRVSPLAGRRISACRRIFTCI